MTIRKLDWLGRTKSVQGISYKWLIQILSCVYIGKSKHDKALIMPATATLIVLALDTLDDATQVGSFLLAKVSK